MFIDSAAVIVALSASYVATLPALTSAHLRLPPGRDPRRPDQRGRAARGVRLPRVRRRAPAARPGRGRRRRRCSSSRSSAWSPTSSPSSLLAHRAGRVAEHARCLPRGARRRLRLGGRDRGRSRDRGHRLRPGGLDRLAADRRDDPAARLVAAPRVRRGPARGRATRRRRRGRASAPRRCGRGRRRARPACLADHQRDAGAVGARHRLGRGPRNAWRGARSSTSSRECVASHFGIDHATFQVEPESHRDHEPGEAHR